MISRMARSRPTATTTNATRVVALWAIAFLALTGTAFGQDVLMVDAHQSPGEWNPELAQEEERIKYVNLVHDAEMLRDEHVLQFPLNSDEYERIARAEECESCDGGNELMLLGINIETDIPIDFSAVRLDGLDVYGQTQSFGLMRVTEDGRLVWTSAIHSEDAGALRVRFAEVSLPESVEMYIYARGEEVHGPYTYRDINDSGDIWTNIISGELSYVELRTTGPATQADLDTIQFRLYDVAHFSDDLLEAAVRRSYAKASATSPVNTECYDNKQWSIIDYVEKGVGFMAYKVNNKWTYCSGGLLNNVKGDETPYFLTANHCLSTKAQAESVTTLWRFQVNCNDTMYRAHSWYEIWKLKVPRSVGAKLLKTGSATDYTLIKLSQKPPQGSWFLGWDARKDYSSVTGTETHRISHPAYRPMSYSKHSVVNPGVVGTGKPVGQYIYSEFKEGLTLGGSSGSPLMLPTGHVVGQLYGNVCNLAGWDSKTKKCKSGYGDNSSTKTTIDGNFYHTFPHISAYLAPSSNGTSPNKVGCSSSTIAPIGRDDFTSGMGSFALVMGMTLAGYAALRYGRRPVRLRGACA